MNYSIQSGKTVEEATQKALDDLKISRNQADIEIIEEPSKGFLGLIGGKDAIVKVSKKFENKEILDSIFDPISFEHNEFEKTKKEESISNEEQFQNNIEEVSVKNQDMVKKEKSNDINIEETIQTQERTQENEEEIIEMEEKQEEVEPEATDLSEEEKNAIIEEYIGKIMEALSMDYKLKIEHKDRAIFVTIDGNKEETGIIIGKRGSTLDSLQYILSLILNSKTDVYNRVILDCSNYREKREATLRSLAHKMAKKALQSNRSVRLEPMPPHERRIIHAALGSVEGVLTHSEGKEPYRRVVIQKERRD